MVNTTWQEVPVFGDFGRPCASIVGRVQHRSGHSIGKERTVEKSSRQEGVSRSAPQRRLQNVLTITKAVDVTRSWEQDAPVPDPAVSSPEPAADVRMDVLGQVAPDS